MVEVNLYDLMVLAICLLSEAMAAGLSARKFLLNAGVDLVVEGVDGLMLVVVGFGDFSWMVIFRVGGWLW